MVPELQEWHVLALATFIGAIGALIAVTAFLCRRWPSTGSRIDISIYDLADEDSESTSAKLFLSYPYTVGNRDYAGENVSLPVLPNLRPDKLSAQRYREGVAVKVYYCPWAPRISC